MSTSQKAPEEPTPTPSPAQEQSPSENKRFSESSDSRDAFSLEQVLTKELERSGLGGIDDNLLKILLIKNLAASTASSPPPPATVPHSSSSIASNLVRWQRLGSDLDPKLATDGFNYPLWSSSLRDLVSAATGIKDYFNLDRSSLDSEMDAGVATLLRQSVDGGLRASLNGKTAYGAYNFLKEQFAASSWSLLLTRWSDIAQAPDFSDSISAGYESLKRSLLDLEERLGGWTTDKLLSLSFHFSLRRYHQALADSMDSRMAVSPDFQVSPVDLLNTATRLHQAHRASSTSPSIMAVSSQQQSYRGGRGRGGGRFGRGGSRPSAQASTSSKSEVNPDSWGRKYLTPEFPCNICWEWGHWAPDCPRVQRGQEPLEDPRLKNPSWRPKKSATLSNRLVHVRQELASITATPDNAGEILCDSGATNHVMSDRSFFLHIRPANIRLRVASQECIPVDGVGDAVVPTSFGSLRLSNVLFCPRVNGTVLSIGYFDKWDGDVSFANGVFTFLQNSTRFLSHSVNYRYFIATPLVSLSPSVSTSAYALSSLSESKLWHTRLGHIAIRFLNRTIKHRCVYGVPEKALSLPTTKCHSCSLSKSTHRPVSSPSRELVDGPGDTVAVDLVGPFVEALDGSRFALVIHDLYSRLTSVVGLKAKSDAADAVVTWVNNFEKFTKCGVRTLRSDNGGEFNSKHFSDFLARKEINHEMAVPYEHHQNGSVERTNRSILDMARTSLLHAKLPQSLWFLALKHSVFIFNRVVHAGASKTPFELAIGKSPALNLVRVFGCRAYLHDPNHPKQFVPRSTPLIHVGVSDESHGWILWNPKTNRLQRGASVTFHEDDLPCQPANLDSLYSDLSAIRVSSLGDFTQLKEFDIQDACLSSLVSTASLMSDAPDTYHQAMRSEHRLEWTAACNAEIDMMIQLKVWEEVPEGEATEILTCRWVFALKRSQEGVVTRFKARIVAQGFRQVHGVNVSETFAPTPTFSSLRLLLAMASRFGWPVASFDVRSAFLHSDIDHDVYIRPPPGVSVKPGCVLKLRKALYGTRQASRCWWLHLKTCLARIGFFPNLEDQSTYTYQSPQGKAFLWIHVDDGLFTASSLALISTLKASLSSVLDLKWDDQLSSIIGLRIREVQGGFRLDQPILVNKITNFLPSAIKTRTPIQSSDLLSNPSNGSFDVEYLSRIGCLLYLAQGSRPDITFAVHFLARFSMNPDASHWAALEHLISYVRYSASLSLPILAAGVLDSPVTTYVDANWGGEGARSVHGFLSLAWGAPVSWSSKRQTCCARSTCQAEYMALSFASKDACFLSSVLSHFLDIQPPLIRCDNRAAVQISSDCGTRKEHRHVDREFHVINELLFKKKVRLEWISTERQLADIFTKALGWRSVSNFLDQTGLRPPSHTLASIGGEVCAGCEKHAPPAIVRLSSTSTGDNG